MTQLPIDLYCERTSAAFWAEPVNAVTNLSFICAALALVWLMRRAAVKPDGAALFLTANIACIGIGSFLFHTFANSWSLLADELPIFVYQLLFLGCYTRRIMGLNLIWVLLMLGAFMAVTFGFGQLPEHWLNGSLSYGSAFVFVAGIGLYHLSSGKAEPWAILLALGVFSLSLSFRSLDMHLCSEGALGTHFLWHLLNAVVLYLTTRAYLVNLAPR